MQAYGINTRRVVAAASSKPFGYLPFIPRGNAGGHCITAAGRALEKAAESIQITLSTLQAANHYNDSAAERISETLRARINATVGSTVLVLGMGYKDECDNYIERLGVKLADTLARRQYRAARFERLVPGRPAPFAPPPS